MIDRNETRVMRFKGLEWFDKVNGYPVIIAGLGGIGSYLAFYLARMQCELHIFDMDTIEETNMGGQHYEFNHIGLKKTEVIKVQALGFSRNAEIYTYGKYEINSMSTPIMFSCFDNMEARKIMFNNWKEQDGKLLFVDGRMSAENLQIFFVTKDRCKEYEEHLFDDNEVADLPCSAKATSHCGGLIASLMVSGFTNFMTDNELILRDMPFKVSFDIPLMYFKTDVK